MTPSLTIKIKAKNRNNCNYEIAKYF